MKILILLLIGFTSAFGEYYAISGRLFYIRNIENHEYIVSTDSRSAMMVHSQSCKICDIEKKHELSLKKKNIELMSKILEELTNE